MATSATSTPRRPRHDPRDTEREILVAAESLLRERPFREVTVERIMLRTGLKRPAFYAHFRDRYELVPRVLQNIELRLFEAANRWLHGDGHERDLRASASAVVSVYEEQGPILRALADGAVSDAKLEETYSALVQAFIDANAEKISSEQASAHIAPGVDARGDGARARADDRALPQRAVRPRAAGRPRACGGGAAPHLGLDALRKRGARGLGRCSSSSLMPSGS